MVTQPLVAIGHHGAAAIPASAPDDVHGVHGECVGGAHHRTDVGVVAEVFDRDVQRVPSGIDIGDDRLARPIAVSVDDIASIAVAHQDWVVTRVVGDISRPWPDAGGGCCPLGGAWLAHLIVHTPAWVPTTATVA